MVDQKKKKNKQPTKKSVLVVSDDLAAQKEEPESGKPENQAIKNKILGDDQPQHNE